MEKEKGRKKYKLLKYRDKEVVIFEIE